MTMIRAIMRKGTAVLAVLMLASAPLGAFVDVSADTTCTPPPQSSYGPGVHAPTGAEAAAFEYQCPDPNDPNKQYVGLWVSEHYVYYPETNKKEPKVEFVYTYNEASGEYDYPVWVYVPAQGSYRQVIRSTATPPAGSTVVGAPKPKPATQSSPSSSPSSSDSTSSSPTASNGNSVSSTGSGSSNTASTDTDNDTTITNTNKAAVNNTISSTTTTGNAMVIGNTTAGNASSGDSVTQANVTNMLQSSSNAIGSGAEVATFTYTIDGDVTGDLLFDPTTINNVQGDTNTSDSLTSDLTVTNTSDLSINNDLDLTSTSGNATVAANTSAGNATTGDAIAIANVVNSIRSAITSGKSFIGTINITGNLNGDILLPADFVDQLIATNTPTVSVAAPGSSNSTNSSVSDTTTVTNTNDMGISNTVTSTAQSGSASVRGNTTAGTAGTGTAKTNVTAFNLTGSKVVAQNSILVYVNVLGKWTGLIMHAPAGATAVQLAGNVSENSTRGTSTTINSTTNQTITNNIDINATSGDADVARNTKAGNANSGDAQTAVNLVNIEDSTLQLSDWFGILYINVFGTWNGSFGMNTDAGNVAATTGGKGGDYLVGNMSQLVSYPAPKQPTTSYSTAAATNTESDEVASTTTTEETTVDDGTVLAATTKAPRVAERTQNPQQSTASSLLLPIIGAGIALLLFGSTFIRKRPNAA